VSAVLITAVALMVPVLFAALGELVSERGGVLNIGLEGMMVVGGYTGFQVMDRTGSPLLAIVAASAGGALVAAVMAAVSIYGRANQIITGFALFILAPGVVDFLYAQQTSGVATVPSTPRLGTLDLPVLSSIPVVGRALFDQNAFFYLALGLAVTITVMLRMTRFGLELSACGEDPAAATTKGVRVLRVRTIGTLCAGALAGIGGAALTVGALGSYSPGVMAGRGFIAIAIVILGRWRVGWVVAAAALVGVADSVRLRLADTVDVPVQLLGLLPWLVVLALLIVGGRSLGRMPQALGRDVRGAS
jgi:ABC-type uncharacterized transport system permease subunit